MYNQTLKFFSGFPVVLAPNAPAKLKSAKLDGRVLETYKDRQGNNIQVSNLSRDYHLYVLASCTFATFGDNVVWNKQTLIASTSLVLHTYPTRTEINVDVVLDGTSPYVLPPQLLPRDVCRVLVTSAEFGGLPLGMAFTHNDGSTVCCLLSPDLLHFTRIPNRHEELTAFKVEYVGIACGPNGNRTVFERARAHEKIVEIQGDFQQRFGNRSLFIFAYNPGYLIQSQSPGSLVMTGPDLIHRLVDGGANSLYEAMEASLIAHFQPDYNIEFKDFPYSKPRWLNGSFRSFNGPVLDVDSIEATVVSDSSFNPDGRWSFGQFRSPSQPSRPLHHVTICDFK